MPDTGLVCRVCANARDNVIFKVREMLFGTREEFDYFECVDCGCVQIRDIPADLGRYYPSGYYSYSVRSKYVKGQLGSPLVRYIRSQRSAYFLGGVNIVGFFVSLVYPIREPLRTYLTWLKNCKADFSSKILDVGCGQGQLLLDLAWYGFNDPIGADKFIKDGLVYDSNVRVYKKDLAQMDGKFDVIMLHHSFEHMPEPDAVMPEIKRLLNENGTVLVRMPIIGTYAWNNYRQNWVALDAPRHLIIYTMKAFEILCTRHGFKITRKIFDSSEFQFIGSEQYMRNIPIYNDSRSYYVNAKNSIFTKSDVRSFKKKTKKLNTEQNGDSVCLYLSKIRE